MEILYVDQLERDVALLGCYVVVTSETDMPDEEIISTYKALVEMEDEFREMKSQLELRPVYVRTPEHISAHIIICFLALLILRLIQTKIVQNNPDLFQSEVQWTCGLSGERVQAALRDWQVAALPGGHFAFTELDHSLVNADLALIRSTFGIQPPDALYTKRMLKIMKHRIEPFR